MVKMQITAHVGNGEIAEPDVNCLDGHDDLAKVKQKTNASNVQVV